MYPRLIIVMLMIGLLLLDSCKKNSETPAGPGNFSIASLTLDGEPYQSTYHNVSVTPQFRIVFSEPIEEASAQSEIFLSGLFGQVPATYSFSNNDSTVSLQPATPFQYLGLYNLQISPTLAAKSKKLYGSNSIVKMVTRIDTADKFPRISDSELLDLVQSQTLKYFTDFAHPASGMARERNSSANTVTTGGSGFGVMALIVGIERGFVPRADGIAQLTKIITFLENADRFHGAWPHWIDGNTGKTIPFSPNDNGADLVETSYMAQGLITLRQYLQPVDTTGNNLINRINNLWQSIEWDWFRRCDPTCHDVLYWHWSPDKGWIMNFALSGYFEEQITYFMAAASPTHSIAADVYTKGYAQNGNIVTGQTYTYNGENHVLYLGTPSPLFWVQYSYLGLDPHFNDGYADYWQQNVNATLINHAFCAENPNHFTEYSDSCWGLTASDNPDGYDAQSPANDNGTISPTAALSSFPYAPDDSMKALKFFYYTMGDHLWGSYGFYDAMNIHRGWFANSTLAIDQGPIVIMIENYRTGLLWNLFMSAPEVQAAKVKLGFQ